LAVLRTENSVILVTVFVTSAAIFIRVCVVWTPYCYWRCSVIFSFLLVVVL